MTRTLLFVGPTITQQQVRSVLLEAEVLPPISSGDLLRLELAPGDLVAIIDGFYFQTEPVRHKEILFLLEKGVHVWGAASMGALRAAELAPFGMKGFGSIFNQYRSGTLIGDDEVAVLHAPKEMGYKGVTEALVNIRYACLCALDKHILTESERQTIIDIACNLPFYERTYHYILEKALERGLSPVTKEALLQFVCQGRYDLKRKDALELLQALQARPAESAHVTQPWNATVYLRDWRLYWQGSDGDDDQWISDLDVLTAGQLLLEDYPLLHYRVLLRKFGQIAERFFSGVSEQIANSTDTQGQKVLSPTPYAELEQSGLPDHQLAELVARYLVARYGFSLVRPLPDSAARWLYPEETQHSRAEQLARIAIRLWVTPQSANWRDSIIQALKQNGRFEDLTSLVYQARKLNKKLQEKKRDFHVAGLSETAMIDWFSQRWGIKREDMNIAIHDRGFRGIRQFLYHARSYYLLDKYWGEKSR